MREIVIDDTVKQAEKANMPAECDYTGEDGLLYCGKCHTPKQHVITLDGAQRTVPCLCQCKILALEMESDMEREREKRDKILKLRHFGFPDERMKKWRFEADDGMDEKTIKIAKNYVKHFDKMYEQGRGLMLFGPVGTGKTFAAVCIANALIDQGKPCLVTTFARLVNILQGTYNGKQEFIDNLNKYALLIIDDLSSERDTEYMDEIVQLIIDSRYRAGLPIIVTTNLTSEEFKHPGEVRKQRIFSRLYEMCIPVLVDGVDRRKKKLIDGFDEAAELLGIEGKKASET